MHQRNPVPGISAAVFVSSQMSVPSTAVVGESAFEGGHTLTADDRFLAGSVGKMFFAGLALRRAGAGALLLDVPLATLLPQHNVPAFAWITTRMLLTHTSGMGEYDGEFMTQLIREPLRVRSANDWLGVVRRNPPLRTDAGTFRYSDMNYVVLAMVLDDGEVDGAYRAIEREFLRPLKLQGTVPSVSPVIERMVVGYDGAKSMFGADAMMRDGQLIYNPQFEWGGGGFASTPHDLAIWIAAFRGGRVFPDSLWSHVVARPPGVADSASHWRGMGVHVDSGALGFTYGHSGYMPGYVSWVRWYESAGISVALQTNASDAERLPDDGFDWADSIAVYVASQCGVPLKAR